MYVSLKRDNVLVEIVINKIHQDDIIFSFTASLEFDIFIVNGIYKQCINFLT